MAYSLPNFLNDDISIFETDDLSSVYTNDQKTEIPPQDKEPVFGETKSNKIKNKMSTNRGKNSTEIKMEYDQPSSSSSSSSNSKQSVENVSPDEENSRMSEDDNYSIPLYLFDEKIPPISADVLEENAQSSSSIVKNIKAYQKSFTEFLNQDPFTFPKASSSSSSSPSEKKTKENSKRKIAERDDDDLNDYNYK